MIRLDVPYDCIWGRIDNSIKNYHRLDLKVHPSREHMRKILQYTPGLFCLFKTKTDKLTVRYKVHFSSTHYVLPIKSKVEPVILGLDKQGLWHMLNYIHVFDTQLEGKIQPDSDLKFSVDVDGDYEMFQMCFPTAARMLKLSIESGGKLEFIKPKPIQFVFIGSSVSQDNYSSNHMNICPYVFRKYGINIGTLGVSGYHTFVCPELIKAIQRSGVKCVLMDVLHISEDEYLKCRNKLKGMDEFVLCDRRTKPYKITKKHISKNDVVVLSGDCMWDSVHLNDFGTVEYVKKLFKSKPQLFNR